MNFKYIYTGLILLMFLATGYNQNILDAYRYSFQTPTGSARFNALGGSMSAIGADMSVASHNPAGIAAFWKSEVSGTLNVSVFSNTATLINGGVGEVESSDFEMTIPQGGIVFTTYSPNKNWMAKSFSITYNKLAEYDNEIFYEGNSLGSISERWAALGSRTVPEDLGFFEARPAYDAYILFDYNYDGTQEYDYDYFRHEDQTLYRSQILDTEGGWSEAAITFAGNYRNKLLIGGTVGLNFVNFESVKTYVEDDPDGKVPQFDKLQFTEYLSTTGVGVNAKIGAIVKFTPAVSWSLSLTSPTVINLTDIFRNTIQYEWTEGSTPSSGTGDSKENQFEYRFVNPWRVSTGLGYKFGRSGFVNGEIDYVGYNFSKFDFMSNNISDQNYENDLNRQIDDEMSGSLNLRIGAEYVINAFRIRGGVFIYSSPLEGIDNTKGFSLGFGFRADNWYLDLAYINRSNTYGYSPYALNNAVVPSVDIKTRVSDVGLTIGFKM